MKKILYLILLIAFASTSLRAQSQMVDTSNIRHTETKGKTYHVRATVKRIYREDLKITLKHHAIKGYMPAMTMTFPVKKSSLLENLREGSKGIFTIFVFKGLPMVTGVSKMGKK
ncbi:MAG: copper-binding protein [Ignavibacteriota bacterium]